MRAAYFSFCTAEQHDPAAIEHLKRAEDPKAHSGGSNTVEGAKSNSREIGTATRISAVLAAAAERERSNATPRRRA